MTAKERRELKEAVFKALKEFREMERQEEDTPLRIEEVAQLTGWTKKTIYNYRDRLKGWKCGATLFFSKKYILSYIEQNKPLELKYTAI